MKIPRNAQQRAARRPRSKSAPSLSCSFEAAPYVPDLSRVRLSDLSAERAWGCAGQGIVWIDPLSPPYQSAQLGDYLPLASLLLHEGYHAAHGADEVGV